MFNYAQTNIQLYNQLRDKGYSRNDINVVQKAYEMAQCWFSGMMLGNGKNYFSHLFRTASILAFSDAPPSVVAAGLIHNAYRTADFGFGGEGISSAKRLLVQETLGHEVEEYVAGFHLMKWDGRTFSAIHDKLKSADKVYRYVVLLRLADHLEHNLDYGVLYLDEKARNRWLLQQNLPIVIEIAYELGFPTLAKNLRDEFEVNFRVAKTFESFVPRGTNFPPRMIPPSYRKRWSIVICEKLVTGLSRVRRRVYLIRSLRPFHFLRKSILWLFDGQGFRSSK